MMQAGNGPTMRHTFCMLVIGLALQAITLSQPAAAQDTSDKQLGAVHFDTSCNETASRRFGRPMAYQHSFWYRQSQAIFEEGLKADPKCTIAYWGVALSLLYNPHAPPPAENLPLGLEALQKGKALGAATQRE